MDEFEMSVSGTSPSALRPYEGRRKSIDTHVQVCKSENLESACVAETERALRPASNQPAALFPNYADG